MADSIQDWTVEDHITYACELAVRAEGAFGETGLVLAAIGRLHVAIAHAKKELLPDG